MLAILHRKIVRGLGMLLDRVNINWAESDKPLTHLGHGIEFLHDDLRPNEVVAFIDGFGSWYHGGTGSRPTVRILTACPNPSIGSARWAAITESIREAVVAIVADKRQMQTYLRDSAGPIKINVNA